MARDSNKIRGPKNQFQQEKMVEDSNKDQCGFTNKDTYGRGSGRKVRATKKEYRQVSKISGMSIGREKLRMS